MELFVNTHGGIGRNIPCDLHNEHINKLFKDLIENMGANFSESASTRASRVHVVSSLERISLNFDKQTGIHARTTAQKIRCGRCKHCGQETKELEFVGKDITQSFLSSPLILSRN